MRFQHFIRLSLAVLSLLLIACDATATFSFPDNNTVNGALLRRADQITKLCWTPLAQVPTQGGYFNQGRTVKGVPYSSVKEMEKFVGQYVSFYTFMTAVSNPKSVLYTENVKEPPYHGTNCSTFYGTVCSIAVNYVLGLPIHIQPQPIRASLVSKWSALKMLIMHNRAIYCYRTKNTLC